MQTLQLTAKQKDKLLEMCKILFPEYKSIEVDLEPTCDLCSGNTIRMSLHENMREHWNDWVIIHFYELMWIILNKICETYKFTPIQINKAAHLFGMVCFNRLESQHPVDYLYEIFKTE